MGARSNIVVQEQDGNRVWLYGHWLGDGTLGVVSRVLSRRERWNDAPYLARMLFSDMVRNDLESELGFGISTTMCDNEYPIIVLEPHTQTAWLEDSVWSTTPRSLVRLTDDVSFEELTRAAANATSLEELARMLGAKLAV